MPLVSYSPLYDAGRTSPSLLLYFRLLGPMLPGGTPDILHRLKESLIAIVPKRCPIYPASAPGSPPDRCPRSGCLWDGEGLESVIR